MWIDPQSYDRQQLEGRQLGLLPTGSATVARIWVVIKTENLIMPATIVVGGQYGSEGKGKVVALRSALVKSPWLVRCGGPNSGHTIDYGGKSVILRQVPSCTEPRRATFCIAAGCAVDEQILISELDMMGIPRERIVVDPRSILIREEDRDSEGHRLAHISSTLSGNGAALAHRMSRGKDVKLAEHSAILSPRCQIRPVAPLLHTALMRGEHVIVEGTQGFGLSLLHGPVYPFVTSKDTTASAFASEVGISPRSVNEIVLVIRTFPIRVGGTSGPFPHEISWEEVGQLSGAPDTFPEYTSVTRKLRRVAKFDLQAVQTACLYNQPTSLAVMGLDRIDYANTGITDYENLTPSARQFLERLHGATGVPIEYGGTGFGTHDVVSVPVNAFRTEYTNA